MIRMIIADDERLIRESLHQLIPWQEIGIEVIATAANGRIAFEKVLELKPDILLSDIEMPELTGIELIKQLVEHKSTCKVIFLTAYSNFSYAQEAIRHGVYDYVLKPIDEALLLKTVKECAETITSTKKAQVVLKQASDTETLLSNNLLKSHLMGILSTNPSDQIALCNLGLKDTIDVNHCMFLIKGIELNNVLHGLHDIPKLQSLKKFATMISPTEILILWQINSIEQEHFENMMYQYATQLKSNFNNIALITMSKIHNGTDLFRHYPECSISLLLFERSISRKVYTFRDIEHELQQELPNISAASLVNTLNEGKPDIIAAAVRELFLSFAKECLIYDLPKLKFECISLLEFLEENYSKNFLTPKDKQSNFIINYKINIDECSSVFSIYVTTLSNILKLSEPLEHKEPQSQLVRHAIQYIHQNYKEASLTAAASKLYVSPTYLSKIFVKEMSESFSQYLLRLRINCSKELMNNPQYKIYEIAQSVGYSDTAHFSKAFKQLEGISPITYRNQLKP